MPTSTTHQPAQFGFESASGSRAPAIGMLSTYPPTQCGLATFSAALVQHLHRTPTSLGVVRVVDDPALGHEPDVVAHLVNGSPDSAGAAVRRLNGFDAVVVQHEYGIYGGSDGIDVLSIVEALTVSTIIVLHTVLQDPTARQRHILLRLLAAADAVVTMTHTARRRLITSYGADPTQVVVVPHGAVDHGRPFPVQRRPDDRPIVRGEPVAAAVARYGYGVEQHEDSVTGLESALAGAEDELDAAGRAVAALARELKRSRAAAAAGQIRDLRRGLAAAAVQAGELGELVRAVGAAYDIDEAELLASGAYAKELLAAAAAAGVAMFEDDDRLLCYPSIVRVLPSDMALEIDRRRARGIRPSVVVEQLRRAQQAGPRFKAAPFLSSLAGAYDLVVAQLGKPAGAVVRLVDVYGVLTLLPGQSREYSKAEFARDLYLLDQSGQNVVGSSGRRLRWAASSGTRSSGVLTTVARSGQQQRYWGIAFEEPTT